MISGWVQTLTVLSRFLVGWLYTLMMGAGCFLMALCLLPRQGWVFFAGRWGRGALWITGIDLVIDGKERLSGQGVYVSNHQSLLDAAIFPAILPARLKFVAKKSLARIPFWGWAFASSGGLMIDRRNSMAAISSIRQGIAKLPPGWSVGIFPEGTRSRDGSLGPFKKGFTHIARETRWPVIPIGMYGAHRLVPKGASLVRPGRIDITVGEPIDTSQWTQAGIPDQMKIVRAEITRLMEISRQRWEAAHPEAEAEVGEPRPAAL